MPGNFPKGAGTGFGPPGLTLEAFSPGDHDRMPGSPWQSKHCPLSSAWAGAAARKVRARKSDETTSPYVHVRGKGIVSHPLFSLVPVAESGELPGIMSTVYIHGNPQGNQAKNERRFPLPRGVPGAYPVRRRRKGGDGRG